MEDRGRDHDLLRVDKLGIEEKFQRSREKCEELEESLVSTVLENCSLEEKLGETRKRCEELEEEIVAINDKMMILREEECEREERLAKMEAEIEALRLDKLNADQAIEELKRKEFETELTVKELKAKNVEANQTIDELRVENVEAENSKTLMVEKLAEILTLDAEYIRDLLRGTADSGVKASAGEGSENDEVNARNEERGVASPEASGDSAGSEGSIKLVGEVLASAAASVEVVDDDETDDVDATFTSSKQTEKSNRTESTENWCTHSDDGTFSDRRRKRKIAAKEKSGSSKRQRKSSGSGFGSSRANRTECQWPLSVEASQWKAEQGLNRRIFPERGITVDVSHCPWLYASIAKKGWEKFVAPPKGYDELLVRDFYASLVYYDSAAQTVLIRGKLVELSADAINAYYRIPKKSGYPPETFHEMDDSKFLEEKIRAITRPDSSFRLGDRYIKKKELTFEARVWMSFNMLSLLPGTDSRLAVKDKALAVYCIIRHHYIDVGRVILRELWAARNLKRRDFVFPCLIIGLCKAKGVPMIDEAHFRKPYLAIDYRSFCKLR